MFDIITRAAIPADLDILLSYEQGIVETERPFDPTLKEGELHYYDLKQMITAPDVEVIVALINDEVVGSGYARIMNSKSYLKHSRYCYLGFMYTMPAHRGKGVNRKVLEALRAWAISQDITELRLEVYHENQLAIKAYEKAGFKPNLVEMRMSLDG
jgi:ribosomal protein S18 acetylase RimI-like enzyme